MINALTGLGYGVIGLAVLIGIGIVILSVLGSNVASCPAGYTGGTGGYNATSEVCMNSTGSTTNTSNPSTATSTINTITDYLGTSNGGLASWVPIIIVLVIGMLFLGAFLTRKGQKA